jgi:hypothetical protein
MTKKDGIRIMNQVDNILNGDNNDQRWYMYGILSCRYARFWD